MISFKEFLTEASSGKAKWEKYFSTGDVETIARADAKLFDIFDKPVKKEIAKGDKLTVLAADEYSPKLRVRIGKGEYLMKLTDIDKPFKVDRAVGINLKPDQLGIFGPKFMSKYAKELKDALDKHDEIPEEHTEYLKALVDLAENPDDTDYEQIVKDLFIMSGASEDTAFKNTINNDFMEALGPFFVVNEKPEYRSGGVKFPEAGNEPLYDFTMKAKRGEGERIDSFSSKRSGGNTNTLKVTEVLKAMESLTAAQRRKYSQQLELLRLIQDNPVKAAPNKINDWLAKTFPAKYKKAPEATDNTAIARLEAAVVKWINESSGFDFVPMVQQAVPDLWYVKAKITSDGTLKVEPLKSGRELGTVKLRSKSSPGHLSDKIGFAL